jgi:gamma-glutamyltranspeptidase
VPDVLASRHGGVPAWSPDSQFLAIATFSIANAGYNGNPDRNDDDPPAAFADADDHVLWRVEAPRAVDAGATSPKLSDADKGRFVTAFDQVWLTLRSLYYSTGPAAAAWDALRAKYRPKAMEAKDAEAVELVIDQLVAEQPPIKPALESSRGVVASGNPLASAAGAAILAQGGNVVDAGIAVSFALGVVEPDASSVGGDGQAILFLKGMTEPVVIEYKDMTPGHATPDNPKLYTATGARTANDGPSVAAIPGVVAGMDLLYQKYGSKKVAWKDLVAPAIKIADEGFVLDSALPTTIAQGRDSFAKYPESAKLFLPNGRVPRAGDRFVNKDYAETLRTIAAEGGQSFYRGTIAKKIAEDMAANGGVITAEDLAQYRAIERKPLAGHYHGHLVYSVPPPVSTGLQIVETLNILDNYIPRAGATYTTDADYFHHVIEAWRVRDGGARIADPERYTVDLGNHLEPAHALERFKLIDPKKVYTAAGGRGGGDFENHPVEPAEPGEPVEPGRRVQTGTTAFVVADAEGNMIAFTQTLSTWGGNYYVSKGLGFLYNDHFRGGGGRGGGFGATVPLMRSSTTSVPTLVFAPTPNDPGRYGIPGFAPRIAVGCAGNAWIPASVYDIILNVVDGGMPAQRAIEAPRFLIGGGAGGRSNVQIEDRIPRPILADLEARGHTFTKVGRKGEVKYGYAAVAVVNAAKGTVEGGAEPRRSHGTAAPPGR